MVEELCLVPKRVINELIDSKTLASSQSKDEVTIQKRFVNIDKEKQTSLDLENEIKRLFKSRDKTEKALRTYSWISKNAPGVEILSNGHIIKPIQNINILDFFKDIYSSSKSISKETLNMYKILIALLDLPIEYIDNEKIKNFVLDIKTPLNPATKRKLSSESSPNPSIKRKLPFTTPAQDDDNNDNADNKAVPQLEKYIDRQYNRRVLTPRLERTGTRTSNRLQSKKLKQDVGSGITAWLAY